MRSAVIILIAVTSLGNPISNRVILDEPVELELPQEIDENKLGQAMLEAHHDNHEVVLPEEQTQDAEFESLLHGFEGGEPTWEEVEAMGISRDSKDWKTEMKAKVFNREYVEVEKIDDIADPMEGIKEEL